MSTKSSISRFFSIMLLTIFVLSFTPLQAAHAQKTLKVRGQAGALGKTPPISLKLCILPLW